MTQDLTVTDLFCGAGGSSLGAVDAGARLRIAANHWRLAIETHNANFPDADHDCADISQVDPRRYPSTDILLASPECTNHSMAKSNKHRTDLFNPEGDPAAERSRATMWDVPRFAEAHRYQAVVVENVVEARRWPPFVSWLMAMESLGYEHRAVYLNSMVAHPTPQSRDRMYVVFWRKGNRRPELDLTADAWCPSCESRVEGRQSWKNPDKRFGKYRSQYLYVCPGCRGVAAPLAFPAASAIDWSLPCPRIGDRAKPLADATRRRVEVGLERFGPAAVVQAGGHTYEAGEYVRAWPIGQPLPVQATSIGQAVVTEPGFVVETAYGVDRDRRVRGVDEPLATQTARQTMALAFIAELRGGSSDARHVREPLSTVTASGNHHAFVVKNYGGHCDPEHTVLPIVTPLGTVTTMDHHSLVSFTVDYHGNGKATPTGRPLPTQDTRDRHALVTAKLEVDDCGFRMLEPHEIQTAMAFPSDYDVRGTKRDKVKQLGNAVTPPAMRRLTDAVIASLS